jgi:transcriptional regulator with XRE-family HTH domain
MKKSALQPKEERILKTLGTNIKLARLRRKFTAELMAERANISRSTLWNIEKGTANVSIQSLLQVLSVLGMADQLAEIASDDPLGRKLQDTKLITPKRIRKEIL